MAWKKEAGRVTTCGMFAVVPRLPLSETKAWTGNVIHSAMLFRRQCAPIGNRLGKKEEFLPHKISDAPERGFGD